MKMWFKRHADQARDAWANTDEPWHAVDLLVAMTRTVSQGNAYGWFSRAGIL